MASRLTSHQKVERDVHVVADRARGIGWAKIAERQGLSERQCRNVWSEHLRRVAPLEETDLERVAEEQLVVFDTLIEDLALLAESTPNDAVRLGALRSKMAAHYQRVGLLQHTGLLPRDLRHWYYELDARQVIKAVIQVIHDQPDLPDGFEDAVLGAFQSDRAGRRNRHTRATSNGN